MLVRRISKYVKEQNWFAVWLDVIIVFVGVFIGLQANNWNEARIAKASTQTYYVRLIEDLRGEANLRLAHIAYFQRTKRHGEAALRALGQPESALGVPFLIDIYQATQTWYYTVQRSTYDELLSGGIANAIPDSTLRAQLANFYLGLEIGETLQQEITAYRDNVRRHMPHAVQSAIRENCGDRIEVIDDYVIYLTLPENCELSLDARVISDALDALRSYSDLEKDLTRHLADLEAKIFELDALVLPTRDAADRVGTFIR